MSAVTAPANELAIWHDVECGSYASDLETWMELAAAAGGPILELGAGTGRVALTLARAGHRVTAADHAPALLAVLRDRAAAAGLDVEAVDADVCTLALEWRFALVIAPMQLLQVLPGPTARRGALRAIRRHLAPGGVGAAAIVEMPPDRAVSSAAPDALPDLREIDGWVYSSLPMAVESDGTAIEARRVRQRVSPAGDLDEQAHVDRLAVLDAEGLDREAKAACLARAGRRLIAADDAYVGSTVCLWGPQ